MPTAVGDDTPCSYREPMPQMFLELLRLPPVPQRSRCRYFILLSSLQKGVKLRLGYLWKRGTNREAKLAVRLQAALPIWVLVPRSPSQVKLSQKLWFSNTVVCPASSKANTV